MKALLVATVVLASSTSFVPASADAAPATWGDVLREMLLDPAGALPATATLNGVERPFAPEAVAWLDRLAAPGTDEVAAPTKDFGTGNTLGQPGTCGVGAFVAVYALAVGVASPPPTVENLDVQVLAPATNSCWGDVFIGSVSGDVAPMPAGGNLAMNSCLYGPGSGFVLGNAICHGGFGGVRPFERFTLAGLGLGVLEFSGCSADACWRFTAMQSVSVASPVPSPGAAAITLADE